MSDFDASTLPKQARDYAATYNGEHGPTPTLFRALADALEGAQREAARLRGIIDEADERIGKLRGVFEEYQETVRVREQRAAEVEAKLEAIERTVKSTKGDPEALAAGLACLGVGDA